MSSQADRDAYQFNIRAYPNKIVLCPPVGTPVTSEEIEIFSETFRKLSDEPEYHRTDPVSQSDLCEPLAEGCHRVRALRDFEPHDDAPAYEFDLFDDPDEYREESDDE